MPEVNLVAVLAPVALAAVAITLIAQFLLAKGDLSTTNKATGMVIGLATLAVTVLGECPGVPSRGDGRARRSGYWS